MMGEMNIVNSLCFSMNYINKSILNKSNQLKLLNKSTQPRQANIDILTWPTAEMKHLMQVDQQKPLALVPITLPTLYKLINLFYTDNLGSIPQLAAPLPQPYQQLLLLLRSAEITPTAAALPLSPERVS